MLSADPRAILPDPPEDLKRRSVALADLILERIHARGPLPFSAFMEAALYEPGLGYYSAGLARFGADGDFVTAPELGQVFARCLARQAADIGQALGGEWDVLEIGAGNGSLAAHLLNALGDSAPGRYLILERSASLKQAQRECLEREAPSLAARVEWLDAPPCEPWQGLLVANEVLDALAVERFCIDHQGYGQMHVGHDGDAFHWIREPAPAGLVAALDAAGSRLPDWPGGWAEAGPSGYHSELCLQLPAWLEAVTQALRRGVALFVDYGYPRQEYYAPERADGTLVCHYRHRAHADPLLWPGLQDISAFVDFTALAEAGEACGLELAGYTSQAMFLIACGLEGILGELESLPERERLARSREIRMLTLPDAMGEKFQCLALARDFGQALRGFSALELRYRL